ncbi:MAG: hypothetical protein HOE90_03530, partial [Bacteriovoracaceae bacterium]|nr:hypothetical protein [Bacteriovoracaceae bacterium]
AKLQNVYITARGGRSGRAGYGERAGNGCRCQYYSWRVAYKCDKNRDGKKNETCYNRYHCTSGSRGRDGYTGSPGRSGSTGVVTIIKSSTALPSEMTSYSAQVKNIVGQDIELSRHLWSTHSGANSLLAPGSYVTDSYYRFDQTIKKSFMVDWSSRRSLSDFSLSVYASLDSARNISLSLQGDVVYKLAEHNDRDLYTIKIEEIYKKSELRNFTVASLSGLGTKTTLSIDDLAGYGDLGSLKVNLVLKKKKGLKKKDLFEGVVPADKMSITKSGLVIDVGEISYKPEKYFDEAGDKYYVEVVIRRTWERQTVKYQSGELKIYLK